MDDKQREVESLERGTAGQPYGAVGPEDVNVDGPHPPPPTYTASNEAIPPSYSQQSADVPPSYDSLYGKVKRVKAESSGCLDFFKKFLVLLCGTIGCTIIIGLVLAIPISMIVMGSVYLHDCPAERYIPIYLIVGGVFGVLKNGFGIGQRVKNKGSDEEDEENSKTNPADSVLNCFLFAWFIAGNVWIYRTKHHYQSYNTTMTSPPYCDETLYQYAFWLTTSSYILIGATCCCIICGGIVAAAAGGKD